ncbi:hypothetical protein SDC9_164462 [bioreactor metagenome]|uniref:Uncharacterized protein n=1 Tax=bioreactor metagenome TaxID=1076179 RepID=A0A645FTY9_9ZZZZ
MRIEPHAGRYEFGGQTMVVKCFLERCRLLDDLRRRQLGHIGNGIVIMELHAVEAHRLVGFEFPVEGNALADFGAEGVGAFVNVPRAERETKRTGHDLPPFRVNCAKISRTSPI